MTQVKLKTFCESRGVLLTGYAPLGSAKRPWAESKESAVLDESVVKQIADKYKKTNSQVLIRFQVMVLFIIFLIGSILAYSIVNLNILDSKKCYSHTKVV